MAGSSCEDISISGGHYPRNCTWSDEVASDIRRYLERGQYPAHFVVCKICTLAQLYI